MISIEIHLWNRLEEEEEEAEEEEEVVAVVIMGNPIEA